MWGIIIGEFVVTVIEMAVDYWDERRQKRKDRKNNER
jgi:hypothetical protein